MPDAISLLWYAASVLGLAEATRKIVVNRRLGHERSRDYLALGLAFIALSMGAGAPFTMEWADRLTGIRNVAFVVHSILAMAAMVCVAGFLRALERLRVRVRVATAVFLLCAAALVVLYLAAGTMDPDFGASRNPAPASLAYTLIYLAYMSTWLILCICGLWSIGRAEERVVRIGVLLAATGIVISLTGLLWKAVVATSTLMAAEQRLGGTGFGVIADAIGLVLFAGGSVFAAAVRHVQDRREHARAVRRDEAVDMLWRLLAPVLADRFPTAGSPQPGLREKIVAIFDARMLLRALARPGLEVDVADLARRFGHGEHHVALLADALEMRAALDDFREDRQGGGRSAEPADDVGDVDARPQPSTLFVDEDQEIDRLIELSDAVTSSLVITLVKAMLSCADAETRNS
ncbi:hypothetical protein [Amycolatopsis sp. lyj-112]|uniref:hypothetical protein n=1 Tax=Amycolatopsis sp. lyj-112 TaxID=2789288 RepID=UPI0039791A85